ncbi:MAG TPA: ABC transporter permease [Symbiobacteriaceae bacterium]|nr:ABC transporter permease [Symbiobacteriaceae bacterium]
MMALAWNVIRENLRNKVLYVLAGIGLLFLFVFLTGSGGKMTDGDGNNLLATAAGAMKAGLAITGVLGALVTVVLSMNTVPREFERQTIHLLLVRPIERWQLAGSFLLGNVLTAWVFLLAMSLPLFAGLANRNAQGMFPALAGALLLVGLNMAAIAGLTTAFSTVISGPAAAFMGLLMYGFGAFGPELSALAARTPFSRLLVALLPPVGSLSGEAMKLFGPGALDGRAILVALIYLWAVAGLTALGLQRREV